MMPVAQTSTFALDIYTIRQQAMFDNPAWAIFLIFLRGKLIGRQVSYPCVSDCLWHQHQQGIYAIPAQSIELSISSTVRRERGGCVTARRTRKTPFNER